MPFIKTKCSKCGKVAEVDKSFDLNGTKVHVLKCGHLLKQEQLEVRDASTVRSMDGKSLYPFQQKGVEFIERSNARALVGDEMGLGKTVQALAFLALHSDKMPAIFILKSGLKVQWQHEIYRWTEQFAQIIEDSKTPILPGLKAYIISYDLIRRFKGELGAKLKAVGVKTAILDECQQIKNPTSQRTIEVREICKGLEHVICLSGTPIKNNAAEYFPVLNILRPEMFPTYGGFIQRDCDAYMSGFGYKVGGLKDPERFMRKTEDFIIRRTRAQVAEEIALTCGDKPDRRFSFCDLGKEVEQAYIDTFKQFRDDYNASESHSFEDSGNILAYLSRMRHLAGLSKIDPCIDFVMEFLGSTDRKITIFVHHKDVSEFLTVKLSSLLSELGFSPALQLTADLDAEGRNDVVMRFRDDIKSRVLIASTLASGEGLNLQFCSDCVILERQWNPANEEQAEARFIRIGQKAEVVTATYFVAVGTVDEFFAEIVERKREIVNSTLNGEAIEWDQSSIMKELSEVLASSGGRKWGI